MNERLILASQSPRRRELIARLGIPFISISSDADETVPETLTPAETVETLARRKAEAVAKPDPADWVLGADTVVVSDGVILGKPADAAEAKAMLRSLSGRAHEVLTGMALISPTGKCTTAVETTRVVFTDLTEEEIEAYVASGEPMDKAGAYGYQSGACTFVDRIEGCYYNVVGLPLARLKKLWRAAHAAEEHL